MSVSREMVFTTCDDLASHDQPVSFRQLYARVGGNHERVLGWWREWTQQHPPAPPLLAESFTEAMGRFLAHDVWEARYQALTQQLVPEAEARLLEVQTQRQVEDDLLHQTQAQRQVVQAEVITLRAELAALKRAVFTIARGETDDRTEC